MNIQPTTPPIPNGTEALRPQIARASAETPAGENNVRPQTTASKPGTLPATNDDVKSAVDKVSSFLAQQAATDLSFSVDDETNIRVIKVVDRTTQEIIRQIPSEEMLQMALALDKLQGLLLKQKA